ncbi:MAG: bifunctional 3-deoxy-7-phosphoheptulonate synthase/chorismate mutase type II [Cytophagales bacterium]|nr:bifunctional 3-deoxy-7-phosphoheptulonate synthase/chorismate mutase type II [Cytophagales bacterium]
MKVDLQILPIEKWGYNFKKPLIISGPCSAETPEQVMQTVKGVARFNVSVIRAGIWKPRTRPGTFEGIGIEGLSWLTDAGKAVGKPVATEIANAKHLEDALKAGVQIVWIGARTTVNPFGMQEIADALKGVDIPVFVKNPINPDLELWIGGLERLNKAGITKLGAIHRGFSTTIKSEYRNKPQWELAIELRRRIPNLPMICDPSHICGTTEYLYEVSQKAMDLNYDGLMIESHINPKVALSDAKQQVTPDELGDILNSLVYRHQNTSDPIVQNKLDELRDIIDTIDKDIVSLIAKRMSVSKEIGQYKKDNNITILQSGRWQDIVNTRIQEGVGKGLSDDFMTTLLTAIHGESIRHQNEVMNKEAELH